VRGQAREGLALIAVIRVIRVSEIVIIPTSLLALDCAIHMK
jgi:hypothetical protein